MIQGSLLAYCLVHAPPVSQSLIGDTSTRLPGSNTCMPSLFRRLLTDSNSTSEVPPVLSPPLVCDNPSVEREKEVQCCFDDILEVGQHGELERWSRNYRATLGREAIALTGADVPCS